MPFDHIIPTSDYNAFRHPKLLLFLWFHQRQVSAFHHVCRQHDKWQLRPLCSDFLRVHSVKERRNQLFEASFPVYNKVRLVFLPSCGFQPEIHTCNGIAIIPVSSNGRCHGRGKAGVDWEKQRSGWGKEGQLYARRGRLCQKPIPPIFDWSLHFSLLGPKKS